MSSNFKNLYTSNNPPLEATLMRGSNIESIHKIHAVITDIQSLLPKLEGAVDTVISLETAGQSLAGLSDILTLLLDPLQGNS